MSEHAVGGRSPFTDVVLGPTHHETGADLSEEERLAHRPAGDPPVDIARGVRLEKWTRGGELMSACEPRGLNFVARRQFGQLYSFVRRDAPPPDGAWDPDGALNAAISLSRLVRTNAHSTRYAARVTTRPGAPIEIAPARSSARWSAWVQLPSERGWLDADEAKELAHLAETYWAHIDDLPPRIRHGLWMAEYAARIYWLDICWPHVVTALEALVHTGRKQSTAQFVERVVALGHELGVPGIDKEFCVRAYDLRSAGVHGERVPFHDKPEAAEELDRLLTVLRRALRRAIEAQDFREGFSSDESVRQHWPLD